MFIQPYQLVFEEPEKKFDVPMIDNEELVNFLKSMSISIEEFRTMVEGTREKKVEYIKPPVPVETGKQNPFYPARIIGLQRPSIVGGRTTIAIMQITEGPYINHVGEVDVSRMFLFGHNLSTANLMDIYHKDDIYRTYVGPKEKSSCEVPIIRAWLGTDTRKQNTPNPELDAWLKRHSVSSIDKFVGDLKNKLVIPLVTPFFPIDVPTTIKASGIIGSIYPPSIGKPNHFGLLRIVSGPLSGESVAFEPYDLYIHGFNMGACKDMSKILFADTKVLVEVRPPLLSE